MRIAKVIDEKKNNLDTYSKKYEPRGKRVRPLTTKQIEGSAKVFCQKFNIDDKFPDKFYDFIDELSSKLNVSIEIVDDDTWGFHVTNGHYDPSSFTIRLPERIVNQATQTKDKDLMSEALEVVFHELGHFTLAHTAVLHDAGDRPLNSQEDAEVQADVFAESVLFYIGLKSPQMEFDF